MGCQCKSILDAGMTRRVCSETTDDRIAARRPMRRRLIDRARPAAVMADPCVRQLRSAKLDWISTGSIDRSIDEPLDTVSACPASAPTYESPPRKIYRGGCSELRRWATTDRQNKIKRLQRARSTIERGGSKGGRRVGGGAHVAVCTKVKRKEKRGSRSNHRESRRPPHHSLRATDR